MKQGFNDAMHIEHPFFDTAPTPYGMMAIVWWQAEGGPRVRQVFLSRATQPVEEAVRAAYVGAQPHAAPEIVALGGQIRSFFEGAAVVFDLVRMALEVCGDFQRRTLMAEYGIPRGWVSTYGRIARHLGVPGGGRAVGRALAENPFPIVIPCHRAVRADGALGGYQGGSAMKRALLAMEGVPFADEDRVAMQRVYY